MRKAGVRDLRYHFPRIERLLRQGERIEITKRKKIIGHLTPVRAEAALRPDFLARLRRIYGDRMLEISGAELLAHERERF